MEPEWFENEDYYNERFEKKVPLHERYRDPDDPEPCFRED